MCQCIYERLAHSWDLHLLEIVLLGFFSFFILTFNMESISRKAISKQFYFSILQQFSFSLFFVCHFICKIVSLFSSLGITHFLIRPYTSWHWIWAFVKSLLGEKLENWIHWLRFLPTVFHVGPINREFRVIFQDFHDFKLNATIFVFDKLFLKYCLV